MRWLLVLASVLGFALAFGTKSSGLLALGLLIGFGCLFATWFAFAAARLEQVSRPDATLLTDADIAKLKASVRKPAAPTVERLPPPKV